MELDGLRASRQVFARGSAPSPEDGSVWNPGGRSGAGQRNGRSLLLVTRAAVAGRALSAVSAECRAIEERITTHTT